MPEHDDHATHASSASDRPSSGLEDVLRALPEGEVRRLREVWTLAGSVEPASALADADVEAAFARFQATSGFAEGASLVPPSGTQRPASGAARPGRAPARLPVRRLAGRTAACRTGAALIALLVLAAAGLYWWTRPVTQTAASGERLTLTLPDGSAVELNSGSTLRYPRAFDAARHVELEGEAFFDVEASTVPFVVATFNAEVRVTGTRFAVRAWPARDGEEETRVALAAGRVSVSPAAAPAEAVEMVPGETRRVASLGSERARVLPATLSVDEATAWRRGDLIFKDAPLGVILRDVERRFGIALAVQPAALGAQRLSLALRQPEGAEAVVHDLAQALGLRYRATATGFEIYSGTP